MPLVGYVSGPPTDFPNPADDTTRCMYDDPHAAALILRTLLMMQKRSIGTSVNNVTLMQRCWDYLESLWRVDGEMAYTWSPLPDKGSWSTVAHGEIIETLVACLANSAYLPVGIPTATIKQRLSLTTLWLKRYGVEQTYNGGDI